MLLISNHYGIKSSLNFDCLTQLSTGLKLLKFKNIETKIRQLK